MTELRRIESWKAEENRFMQFYKDGGGTPKEIFEYFRDRFTKDTGRVGSCRAERVEAYLHEFYQTHTDKGFSVVKLLKKHKIPSTGLSRAMRDVGLIEHYGTNLPVYKWIGEKPNKAIALNIVMAMKKDYRQW